MSKRFCYKKARVILYFLLVLTCTCILWGCGEETDEESVTAYQEKVSLLKEQVLTEQTRAKLGNSPAQTAGNAVFLSVCDTAKRAWVFIGTGDTVDDAWENASQKAQNQISKENLKPEWLKADIVYHSETVSVQELKNELINSRKQFLRYGVALDSEWQNAFLEAELNGTKSFDYETGIIDLRYLNHYLQESGRNPVSTLPEEYTIFQCMGWFCDESNIVYPLTASCPNYGVREIDSFDDACAQEMILNATDFLASQVKEDGSFVYGIYPRFGNEIEDYNIIYHASAIRSLLCHYRMKPDAELEETIRKAIDYMLTQVIYDNEGNAWLYDKNTEEIKLGGCAMAVIVLTDFMNAFESNEYMELCQSFGRSILSLLDRKTGEYYHVLNRDFSRKEAFRTVYYDGESTFALCRLYRITGEAEWLFAARDAVDHFIRADYTQYRDHWVAYAMNEITKYITNDTDYYTFALKNAQVNLEEIYNQDTTCHTYLELLMSTFELYDRMVENGVLVQGFDLEMLLKTIYQRANYMRTGYFYPEYAMYMLNPKDVLNSFMIRHEGFRIRIDDIQHNVYGYYRYYINYDRLVKYGMLNYSSS